MSNIDVNKYFFNSVSIDNTLPITSRCNLNCFFCSNNQNNSLSIIEVKEKSFKEIKDIIEFLNPNRPIVIGESATRFFEGDPFLYPEILKLLDFVRKKFPETEIKITTNGELLDSKILQFLYKIGKVSLTVSLNYLSLKLRKKYLNSKRHGIELLDLLEKSKINYLISKVIFPIDNFDFLDELENFLNEAVKYKRIIRLLFAGMTESSLLKFDISQDKINMFHRECQKWVAEYRKTQNVPIIFEPYFLDDFEIKIDGVINSCGNYGSVGHVEHVAPGDKIISVNGHEIMCGTELSKYLYDENNCVTVKKPDSPKILNLQLTKDEKIIVKKTITKKMYNWLKEFQAQNPRAVILVSKFVEKAFKTKFDRVFPVSNMFIGGNIYCYGLLTFSDIKFTLSRIKESGIEFSKAIISPNIMDYFGKDISGETIYDYPDIKDIIVIPPEI